LESTYLPITHLTHLNSPLASLPEIRGKECLRQWVLGVYIGYIPQLVNFAII